MGRIANNNIKTAGSAGNLLTDLCCRIYQGEYILVLGDDIVLRSEYGGGNSREYILKEFLNDYNERNHTACSSIHGIPNLKGRLKEFLSSGNWEYDFDTEASPELVSLLSTKCFRVVLTTTFDQYIEKIMRNIWKDELRVMSIYDTRGADAFLQKSEYSEVPPTLFYAFGKAGLRYDDFTLTENDAIKVISRWLSKDAPNDMIRYIADKKVLAIGCKFEDWFFRFFWYCLRQDIDKLSGDVAISLDPEHSESDRKLAEYLRNIDVENKGNSRLFTRELSRQLNDPDEHVYKKYATSLRTGGIFISYASEDFPIVCQIYTALSEAGIPVWFDNKNLSGGDHYNERIHNAISQCRIFIPILSAQTKKDIENGTWRYYKDVEWEAVNDNRLCRILPVTLYGFDINRDNDLLPPGFREVTVYNWSRNGAEKISSTVKKLND